jgi:hypothetical protein
MRELRGSASAVVTASPEECQVLLLDIERYPEWYPEAIRRADVVREADATTPARARTTVHLGVGPVQRDFDLLMEVTSEPGPVVRLVRVGQHGADPEGFSVVWRIDQGSPPGATRLSVDLSAHLDVPRLLPTHGVGDAVARGFVSAAARALDQQA